VQRERKKALKTTFKTEEARLLQDRRNGRPGLAFHKL
jgi:hypothetical protein